VTAAPIDEETERPLILSLVHDLNNLFSTDLCEDTVVDRYLDEDVFYSNQEKKQSLILIGASHLNHVAEKLVNSRWTVYNLYRPGFHITKNSVAKITSQVEELRLTVQLNECTVLLQLYDNSVHVGGPGSVRYLSAPDNLSRYHIDGTLQVADKTAIKEMTVLLTPLIKALGQARKAFLAPLTRYWIKPCCDNVNHHVNYSAPSYLMALGASVFRLRDNIRDALFKRRTSNFRVVCANKLMGIGPHLSDQAASDIS
jgi:hypothetical protein